MSSAIPTLSTISNLEFWPVTYWVSRKVVTQALVGNLFVLFHVQLPWLSLPLSGAAWREQLLVCSALTVGCPPLGCLVPQLGGSEISFHWKKRAFVKALAWRMAFCKRPQGDGWKSTCSPRSHQVATLISTSEIECLFVWADENTPGYGQISKKFQHLLYRASFLISLQPSEVMWNTFFHGVQPQIEKPTAVDCERVSVLTFQFISLKTNFISKILGNSAVDF